VQGDVSWTLPGGASPPQWPAVLPHGECCQQLQQGPCSAALVNVSRTQGVDVRKARASCVNQVVLEAMATRPSAHHAAAAHPEAALTACKEDTSRTPSSTVSVTLWAAARITPCAFPHRPATCGHITILEKVMLENTHKPMPSS
jgi:hypothetical protein